MDIIETKTATRVEMLARDKTTVGSLEPAPESVMFWWRVLRVWRHVAALYSPKF